MNDTQDSLDFDSGECARMKELTTSGGVQDEKGSIRKGHGGIETGNDKGI